MSVVPNAFAVSKDMLMLFNGEYLPLTEESSPRIELMMACNNALDAELSDVKADSPSDSWRIADAWVAVMPTILRFSVKVFKSVPAWSSVSRADIISKTRSLHEQRR